jgi:hypothetical protein
MWVHATNKTGSSSDYWIYYHLVTHSLLITSSQYHCTRTHMKSAHLKSSQDDCSQLATHDLSLNWKLSLEITRSDLLQILTFRGCLPPRIPWKRTSVSPTNPRSDTRKNAAFCIVADVMRCGRVKALRSADVTWSLLTVERSKLLQLPLRNGERIYLSAA